MEIQKKVFDYNYEDLKTLLNEKIGVKKDKLNMRAQQIFSGIYQKGLRDFNLLSTIPLELRSL